MEPFKNTGYIPKHATLDIKPDPRNWKQEELQPMAGAPLPYFYKTDISKIPVLMQGQTPACVAHAVVYAMEYYFWKKTGVFKALSPRYLYAMCKTIDGLPADAGTYLEIALSIARHVGVCEESYFPNMIGLPVDEYADHTKITPEANNNAALYRIPAYAFLSHTDRQSLNQAIFQNGMVIVGQKIGSEWWEREDGVISWSANDILPIRPPNSAHPVVSGHCTVEYAFGQYAHGINEWSTEWGYNGLYWYGQNEQPFVYEAAVIGDLPTQPAPPPPAHEATLAEKVEQVVENVVEQIKSIV